MCSGVFQQSGSSALEPVYSCAARKLSRSRRSLFPAGSLLCHALGECKNEWRRYEYTNTRGTWHGSRPLSAPSRGSRVIFLTPQPSLHGLPVSNGQKHRVCAAVSARRMRRGSQISQFLFAHSMQIRAQQVACQGFWEGCWACSRLWNAVTH